MASEGMAPFQEINPRQRRIPVQPYFLQLGGQPKAMPIDYDQLRMSRQLQLAQFGNPSVVQNVFVQAMIPLTTKGDLLSRDGNSNNVRVPVGSRDQAVVVDPDNANGVRWSDRFWVYNKYRRESSVQTQMSASPVLTGWVYAGGFPSPGAWTADVDGAWSTYTTTAALNNFTTWSAGLNNGEFVRTGQLPAVFWKVKTGPAATDVQNVRVWLLCYDSGPGNPFQLSDTPLIHCFGFRFSTAAGDTSWAFYCSNSVGGTQTVGLGPVVAADTVYKLGVVWKTTSAASVYVNDTLVATVTLNLPASTQAMVPSVVQTNLVAGTTRTFKFGKLVCNQE